MLLEVRLFVIIANWVTVRLPTDSLLVMLVLPTTFKVCVGFSVLIPTRLLVSSTFKVPLSTVKLPMISRVELGSVNPIPVLPPASIASRGVKVPERSSST